MEEESINRPKWLLELENRKRKPRLAHEAGAGAPCMNCKSACPGLDLHFWRKICKICKCSRDDHDVDDDEFPQFDLLFGPSGKFKKKSLRMRINNNNKEPTEEETTFDWIPPDTTKELAIDYMKALPAEKLPIKGSTGAVLRRQLLQKQLPLHDIDHKVCNKLSEQEQKQFEKYLENIKNYVGQGKVIKMFDIRPFDSSLITPVNATDMQHLNPQYKSHVPSAGVQLRTPSSFAIKTSYAKQPYEDRNKQNATVACDNKLHNKEEYNRMYTQSNTPVVNSNIARSQPLEGKFYENSQSANNVNKRGGISSKVLNTLTPARLAEQEIVPARTMQTSGKYTSYAVASPKSALKNALQEHRETLSKDTTSCVAAQAEASEAVSIADSMLAEALLPPSAIHANDIIGSTLDEKGLMFIREKLTDKYNATDAHVASQLSRPLDAKCKDILQYPCSARAKEDNNFGNNNKEVANKAIIDSNTNSLLNRYNFSDSNTVPVSTSQYSVDPLRAELNSSILQPTVIHSEQLQNQVFGHIIGSTEQPTIPAQNIQQVEHLKDGIENLKVNATKMQKCENCHEDIRIGDVAVIAEKANNASWHPGCFVCSICNELLVDLVYFYYKNKLYCGRDLATFLGIPRCFACDELIFVREYTVAEGHNYHVKHFCCWDCDMPLAGQQYITENDRPLCLLCYQQSYAKVCAACNIVIAADQQGVAIKDLNFHATKACFCCHSCNKNLLNGKMAIKENKLFCSKECIAKFLH